MTKKHLKNRFKKSSIFYFCSEKHSNPLCPSQYGHFSRSLQTKYTHPFLTSWTWNALFIPTISLWLCVVMYFLAKTWCFPLKKMHSAIASKFSMPIFAFMQRIWGSDSKMVSLKQRIMKVVCKTVHCGSLFRSNSLEAFLYMQKIIIVEDSHRIFKRKHFCCTVSFSFCLFTKINKRFSSRQHGSFDQRHHLISVS